MRDGLATLLERLAELPTPHTKWIRFLYAYPNRITQRLLDTIAAHEAVVNYIDLPLQHASPRILKRMKRGGGAGQFLRLLERIRKTIPGVAIRTSMIVGFPGETDRDFEELCRFVEEARFDHLGVFSYSDEETSESYHFDGKVSRRTIYNRRRRLMAIQRRISRRRNRALVGKEFVVLVEGPSAETELLWQGRQPGQAPEIDGVCYITDDDGYRLAPGQLRRFRVERASDYDLVGPLLGAPLDSGAAREANLLPVLPMAGGQPAVRRL